MKSSFQTIILVVFIIAFVVAIAIFSGLAGSGSSQTSTELSGIVTIWGTLPTESMQEYLNNFNSGRNDYSLNYVQLSPDLIAQSITSALAEGTPPDIVLVNSEIISQFKDKLYPIPYSLFSERLFRDTYTDGSQLFLDAEGVRAVPLVIDPLVVYYNKDILARANYALPPRSWDDVLSSVGVLTTRDIARGIDRSTIALGEADNVLHFRDILSALFLQAGNPIVQYDATRNVGVSQLAGGTVAGEEVSPTQSALSFFLSFADPNLAPYSWNRGLPTSLDMFLSGRLAFYIGRASELFAIQAQNPNLNFDVMELFQPANAVRPITYGSFIGVSVMKSAPNFAAAYDFAARVSADPTIADFFSKQLSMPPARRSLLLVQQQNPYVDVFFKAALSAFAWRDPNPVATEAIFRDMITSVTSGRNNVGTALNEATQRLQSYIR
ncbi:extracellular solute-binding protein [Candidatus Nomurabacteria bacterium]|nr:extracellular solute-binding protein [Candidatus Nomurabacteria bacterium]